MKFKSKKVIIAPSILSADFACIGKEVARLKEGGADIVHCDVMDGHFVPNLTFGAKFVKDLRKMSDLHFDVHLMISDPEKYVNDFIKAGADSITFHYEAQGRPEELLSAIRSANVMCGLAISPDTPVCEVEKYIPMCDIILIMSVYPGFGGQKFIESSYEKIKNVKEIIARTDSKTLIEIDGGVVFSNVSDIKKCGADIIVAGNAVFGSDDVKAAIENLRNL